MSHSRVKGGDFQSAHFPHPGNKVPFCVGHPGECEDPGTWELSWNMVISILGAIADLLQFGGAGQSKLVLCHGCGARGDGRAQHH